MRTTGCGWRSSTFIPPPTPIAAGERFPDLAPGGPLSLGPRQSRCCGNRLRIDGHEGPCTRLLVVPGGTDTLQRPSHGQWLFAFDDCDRGSDANVRREHRNTGGRVMTNVRARLVAGFAAATCLLAPAAWASSVVVIRCEAQAAGYISVTHWTYSSDVHVDLGDGRECAESLSMLLEAGFRLPFAPTTTVSGPDRERVSFSFIFFAGSGSQVGSNGNSQGVLPALGEHPQLAFLLHKAVEGFKATRAETSKNKSAEPDLKTPSAPSARIIDR